MSQNDHQQFVNIELWNIFRKRFKSKTTEASYWSDIQEFCRITGKPFTETVRSDVTNYYNQITDRMKAGQIRSITRTKKFRELHSFASFLMERGEYMPGSEFDFFYPYLKNMKKESAHAGFIPVEDMDALLHSAVEDEMAYTILTLMYRAGLTSTEIAGMKSEEDFAEYERGALLMLANRQDPCYIPEDAWNILKNYMSHREMHGTLFYNRNGCPLNTMYISRMMKKYCIAAGIADYSAQEVRNSCAYNLFAYGADEKQTAEHMGRTVHQIKRYKGMAYRGNLKKQAADLVKIHIEKP